MPAERPEVASAPTRRSNRLRTAHAVDASSASSDAGQLRATIPTAAEVASAATSRRARRLAAAGAPVVQPMTEPVEQAVAEQVAAVPAAPAVEPVAEASEPSAPAAQPEAPAAQTEAPAVKAPDVDAPDVDAFAVASEAFGFAPVEDGSPEAAETAVETEAEAEADAPQHVAPRRPRVMRKVVAAGASIGVMGIAGLIAVSMTLPASAVAAVRGAGAPSASLVAEDGPRSAAEPAEDEIQAFVASSGVQDETLARSDSFSTVSLAEVAAEAGIDYSGEIFTNDPDAAIQWPFKVGVGMSYGYGMRSGRLHEGIDFTPGNGAPIQAIADGKVRIATEQGGAYGVTVYIDHMIDGKVITSHYAHMQYGSLRVQAGETVKVGTVIGRTGNTGRSYGAHLHFELIVNGSTIDPMPWLRKNAGRNDGVSPVS